MTFSSSYATGGIGSAWWASALTGVLDFSQAMLHKDIIASGARGRLLCAAGLATATATAMLYTCRYCNASSQLSEDEVTVLRTALAEISKGMFYVCRDVTEKAKLVRIKIKEANLSISDDRLNQQLIRQCHILERFAEVQARVAGEIGLTGGAAELDDTQRRAAEMGNPEVALFEEGCKMMLEDALSGRLPVLPGASIPEGLTEDRVLKVQADAQNLEIKKVVDKVGGKQCTPAELNATMTLARTEAWAETFAELSGSLEGASAEVFYSALGTYMRNHDFEKDLKKLENAFLKRLRKLFRPNPAKGAREDFKVPEKIG